MLDCQFIKDMIAIIFERNAQFIQICPVTNVNNLKILAFQKYEKNK